MRFLFKSICLVLFFCNDVIALGSDGISLTRVECPLSHQNSLK